VSSRPPGRLAELLAVFTAPYRPPAEMVLLCALVPFYIFIPQLLDGRTLHRLALAVDGAIPLVPGWAVVYGSLYLFLIVLPIFLVRDQVELRNTARAYLTVWLLAYVVFLAYPTVAARPAEVSGSGFPVAGLRFLYSADTRFNCFPSLHVAHSFVSAFACRRVHRRVGNVCFGAAALVALSTLFTKQHYVVDVVAGVSLAAVAAAVFLRPRSIAARGSLEHRVAPMLAGALACALALAVGVAWLTYRTVTT
jgi:membrane-associated phospholipid phosphatase